MPAPPGDEFRIGQEDRNRSKACVSHEQDGIGSVERRSASPGPASWGAAGREWRSPRADGAIRSDQNDRRKNQNPAARADCKAGKASGQRTCEHASGSKLSKPDLGAEGGATDEVPEQPVVVQQRPSNRLRRRQHRSARDPGGSNPQPSTSIHDATRDV